MSRENWMDIIEWIALLLETAGILAIALAFMHGILRGLRDLIQQTPKAYARLKKYLGNALLLGLEFLVAADIIRTVTVELTMERLQALGLLVILRIVLGWSIAIEIEGCWPWKHSEQKD